MKETIGGATQREMQKALKSLIEQVCKICQTETVRYHWHLAVPETAGEPCYVIYIAYLEHRSGLLRQFFPVSTAGPTQATLWVSISKDRKEKNLKASIYPEKDSFRETLKKEIQKYADRFGFSENEVLVYT